MDAALYGLICLIWGSTWVAIKVGLIGVPPFLGAGLRFLLASMGLGAACLLATSAATESWSAVVWSRANVLALLYLSFFGSVIAFWVYYSLIKKIDATTVSLI